MSRNKVISAIVHFFTAGVTFERFHAIGESAKKKLDDTRCYWNDQHRLVVVLNGQEHELDVVSPAPVASGAEYTDDIALFDAIADIAKATGTDICGLPRSRSEAMLFCRHILTHLRARRAT